MGVDLGTRLTASGARGAHWLICLLATLTASVSAGVPSASAKTARRAILRVNTFRDELAPHDGKCSLREAIAAVNAPARRADCGPASRRSDIIVLRRGLYTLTIRPRTADGNASGDLNVTGSASVTISGAGVNSTRINATPLGDRVLSVASGARLTLLRLSLSGGHRRFNERGANGQPGVSCTAGGAGGDGFTAIGAGDGGGVYNSGSLVLDTVAVNGNAAGSGGNGGTGGSQKSANGCPGGNGGPGGVGGGVYNRGRLTLMDTEVFGNSSGRGGHGGHGGKSSFGAGGPGGLGGPGGNGGGIYNQGRLSVIDSTIDHNFAGGGGAGGRGGAGTGTTGEGGAGGLGSSGAGIFNAHGRLRVINSTVVNNVAGAGGTGGAPTGPGGTGGSGGAIAAMNGHALLRNGTVADNAVGSGGVGGSAGGAPGTSGAAGGLFVQSTTPSDDMTLQNTIMASNTGSGCVGAISNGGHDLSYGDKTCPGREGNPHLGPLRDNGGRTVTMSIGPRGAARNGVPRRGAHCPSTDQRRVRRPQGRACDIGAFEYALPTVTVISPSGHGSYELGSRIRARFRCTEGGIFSAIARCTGSVPRGHAIRTKPVGTRRFVVTAMDKDGHLARKIIHYVVWKYVNPLSKVSGLTPRRIDLGVDYAGWGPLLALGKGRVTTASNTDSGPSSCWAISCWPGGGIVVYRLLEGPFAGKYVYVAEHITVSVRAGQIVRAGHQIATLHSGYPWSEFGWAAGPGPEALAMADGHRCTCSDPGGWSTIEGRNFDHLLVQLGAPSGYLQATPDQSMPPGWPTWSG